MTETALTELTITPDQPIYLLQTIDAPPDDAGTVYAYALATEARIDNGRLTMLAGDDVLDVSEPGTWAYVGRVRLAPGQYEVQRDGRAVRCRES